MHASMVRLSYQRVQFHGLVGCSPVFVLARILPDPEMEIVLEFLHARTIEMSTQHYHALEIAEPATTQNMQSKWMQLVKKKNNLRPSLAPCTC